MQHRVGDLRIADEVAENDRLAYFYYSENLSELALLEKPPRPWPDGLSPHEVVKAIHAFQLCHSTGRSIMLLSLNSPIANIANSTCTLRWIHLNAIRAWI